MLCASTTTFTFQVSFAVIYTHTHTHLHTPTHTLIYIPTTTTNHCVCSSDDRRLNKIKFDNRHYVLHLFLFGKTPYRAHNIGAPSEECVPATGSEETTADCGRE